MNKHEKEVLAGLCRIEIRRWRKARDKQYMVDLMEIALASLTAESVDLAALLPDAISVRKAIAELEQADAVTTMAQAYKMAWNACRAEMLRRIEGKDKC